MGTFPSSGEAHLLKELLKKKGGNTDGIQWQFFRLHPKRALYRSGGLDAGKECISEYLYDYLQNLSGQ